MATETKPRSFIPRDYELRRLLDVGTVDVWRAMREQPEPWPERGPGVWAMRTGRDTWTTNERRETRSADAGESFTREYLLPLDERLATFPCPFGRVGDTVAVREAVAWDGQRITRVHYLADGPIPSIDERHDAGLLRRYAPNKMPPHAVRLKPTLTAVRVARVQGVTAEETLAAGIDLPECVGATGRPNFPKGFDDWPEPKREEWINGTARAIYFAQCADAENHIKAFADLHDAHTRNPAHKWEANPSCFVGTLARSER
jgi:hypothetical protein